jgi:formylglycine-generating enzyme
MSLPRHILDRYHRELNDVVKRCGLDIFRVQQTQQSPYMTLRVCCGGPTEARLQGFKEMFRTDKTFIHTNTLMAGNSLIGSMGAHVVVLFFKDRADFNAWAADGVEADFLKLTQPVNADKLFVVVCAEQLPKPALRDIVGSDNIQTTLDVAQATRTYGAWAKTDPYIDAMVMIPSGNSLYGKGKSSTLPDDARGIFMRDTYLVSSSGQVDGGVFYKCYPPQQGAINLGVGKFDEVTVAQPFLIAQSQVTQALYRTVMRQNPSFGRGSQRPVHHVSWFDMLHLANALSGEDACYQNIGGRHGGFADWREGCRGFRLPTEREWEYVYRAFSSYEYSGGDTLSDVGWYRDNADAKIHPVGQLKPNTFGVYDMAGNATDWCWDAFHPKGPLRVVRGGSWYDGADNLRATKRDAVGAATPAGYFSGRLSRSLP